MPYTRPGRPGAAWLDGRPTEMKCPKLLCAVGLILPADPGVREVGSARVAEQGRREGVTWLRGKPYTPWQVPHKHLSDRDRGTAT